MARAVGSYPKDRGSESLSRYHFSVSSRSEPTINITVPYRKTIVDGGFDMANTITPEKKAEIISTYMRGYSQIEVAEMTGVSKKTVWKWTRGLRGQLESVQIIRASGRRYKVTDETRQKLSAAGIRQALRNGKYWTKPEREFADILRSMGIAVGIPQVMCDALGLVSDENPLVFAQYPVETYLCDFVDVKNGVVFRVQGDFWHANPILYGEDGLSPAQLSNRRRDANARRYLEKKGWLVCDIWQTEIEWNRPLVEEKIRAARELGNPPLLQRGIDWSDSSAAYQKWEDTVRSRWFKRCTGKGRRVWQPGGCIGKGRPVQRVELVCQQCGGTFEVQKHCVGKRPYCSQECSKLAARKVKDRPSAEVLAAELSTSSYLALGRKYGVSDKTIRKWATSYGLL